MSPLIERTCRPDAMTSCARPSSTAAHVEDVGDVVADSGQRAEVDLGEAEAGDRRQRLGQRLVPKLIVEQPSRLSKRGICCSCCVL